MAQFSTRHFWFAPSAQSGLKQAAVLAGWLLVMVGLPVAAAPRPFLTAQGIDPTAANQQTLQPGVPPRPAVVPDPVTPEISGITSLPSYPSDSSGVGHLRPTDLTSLTGANWPRSPLLYTGWLKGVALPIYPSPDSPPWGWLINGWLIPNGAEPLAIGRDASFSMVPTERRVYTFPVLEVRPDGWFRFQYTSAGAAWAHTSHLNLGPVSLTVEPWSAYMRDASRVAFRSPGLSQPMRLAPSGGAPLQALVGPDSIIQPLDMEGDWLRVRVTQPAQGCIPLPGANTEEGWVRWRDEAQTPLVWVPDSGC